MSVGGIYWFFENHNTYGVTFKSKPEIDFVISLDLLEFKCPVWKKTQAWQTDIVHSMILQPLKDSVRVAKHFVYYYCSRSWVELYSKAKHIKVTHKKYCMKKRQIKQSWKTLTLWMCSTLQHIICFPLPCLWSRVHVNSEHLSTGSLSLSVPNSTDWSCENLNVNMVPDSRTTLHI